MPIANKYNPKNHAGWIISAIFHVLILFAPISLVVVEGHNFQAVELMVTAEDVSSLPKKRMATSRPEVKSVNKLNPEEIKQILPENQTPLETNKTEQAVLISKGNDTASNDDRFLGTKEVASIQGPTRFENKSMEVEFGSHLGPAFIHRELPRYPFLARRMGKEGKVILRLTIDEIGNLQNVEVIKGEGYGFTEAAIKAVKTSTFRAATKEGKPISSRALLQIKFSLKES